MHHHTLDRNYFFLFPPACRQFFRIKSGCRAMAVGNLCPETIRTISVHAPLADSTRFYGPVARILSGLSALFMARPLLTALSFSAATALADETIQRFVPGRSGQISDVLIDCAGSFAGVLLFFTFFYTVKRTRSSN